jgi:hypothetical protein
VRARGTASADGSSVVANEIVSLSLRTFAGLIVSVNPEFGEMRFRDLGTKKLLVLAVNKDGNLRRLEQRLAERIARQIHPELADTVTFPQPG